MKTIYTKGLNPSEVENRKLIEDAKLQCMITNNVVIATSIKDLKGIWKENPPLKIININNLNLN